jgi:hypothetical protein
MKKKNSNELDNTVKSRASILTDTIKITNDTSNDEYDKASRKGLFKADCCSKN